MRLFTNIGNDNYGEYFVFNLREAKVEYKNLKNCYPDQMKSFNDYLSDLIELDENLEGYYTTNCRNKVCKVKVQIDNKKLRNLISYEEELIN